MTNKLMHLFGLHLSRFPIENSSDTCFSAMLGRLTAHNIPINTVIDIGASNGCWSRKVMEVYPLAKYMLIEANPIHEPALNEFIGSHRNAEYALAAAGDRVGTVYFDDSDPFGGTAFLDTDVATHNSFPCTTVDVEVKERDLRGPFLLKLDTHGFELPIFEGAKETLKLCNILVIETYNFNLTGDCLRFWEMCTHLATMGFRPLDVMEPMFRPKDQAFWQIDIVFATDSLKLYSDNKYK